LAFDTVIKAALVAQLSHDIAVSLREEGFVEFEDVGMVHHLQDPYLLEDKCLEVF